MALTRTKIRLRIPGSIALILFFHSFVIADNWITGNSGFITSAPEAKIGIGIPNPVEKMEILGNLKINGTAGVTGYFGVGTIPTYKLDVLGAGAALGGIRVTQGFLIVNGLNTQATGGTVNDLRIGFSRTDRAGFTVNNLEVLTLKQTGSPQAGVGVLEPVGALDVRAISNGQGGGFGLLPAGSGNAKMIDCYLNASQGGVVDLNLVPSAPQNRIRLNSSGVSFLNGGNVGIGTSTPSEPLEVAGNIKATNLIATNSIVIKNWKIDAPDYVFETEYKVRPLPEVEMHIRRRKHLPDMPSAKEFKENGMDIMAMNYKLLQKVEELTLYAIEQDKRIKKLESPSRKTK